MDTVNERHARYKGVQTIVGHACALDSTYTCFCPNQTKCPWERTLFDAVPAEPSDLPLKTMVGGDHYLKCVIQPLDYIFANKLGFVEGAVVKYVTRWRDKGGIVDLEKARDMLDKYIANLKKENA